MAQLKSVACVDLTYGETEVFSVGSTVPFVKLTELILANHSTNAVNCKIKIYKANINKEATISSNLRLEANENNFITCQTALNTNDKILINVDVNKAVDVLISCVEM